LQDASKVKSSESSRDPEGTQPGAKFAKEEHARDSVRVPEQDARLPQQGDSLAVEGAHGRSARPLAHAAVSRTEALYLPADAGGPAAADRAQDAAVHAQQTGTLVLPLSEAGHRHQGSRIQSPERHVDHSVHLLKRKTISWPRHPTPERA